MSTTAATTLLVALAALFSLGVTLPLKASEKPNSNSYKSTPFGADDKSFRQGVMKLPAFNAVPNQTTISGLSSGAFFAVQMGVAFSSIIKGVGVFAGGPYHCALGNIMSAEENCMYALPPPNVPALVDITTHRSTEGVIDDISNLADQRVYMFTGTDDAVVRSSVVSSLYNYLTNFVKDVSQLRLEKGVASAHTQPTDFSGLNPCTVSKSPYLSTCNYDGAGIMLQHIFGQLKPKASAASGIIVEFDQTEFVTSASLLDLADTGFAYIPLVCSSGQPCRVHVALHGCLQNYASIGKAYVQSAGYNEWADTNSLVIIYPQTVASVFPVLNPNSCWDWWGYIDPLNYDTRDGAQMQFMKKIIDRATQSSKFDKVAEGAKNGPALTLPRDTTTTAATAGAALSAAGFKCESFVDNNVDHVLNGRAYVLYGLAFAYGSNDPMGLFNVFVFNTLSQTRSDYFILGPCA